VQIASYASEKNETWNTYHRNSVLEMKESLQCGIYDKQFTSKSSLKTHVKNVQEEKKS
jgi:hypothetical protein